MNVVSLLIGIDVNWNVLNDQLSIALMVGLQHYSS